MFPLKYRTVRLEQTESVAQGSQLGTMALNAAGSLPFPLLFPFSLPLADLGKDEVGALFDYRALRVAAEERWFREGLRKNCKAIPPAVAAAMATALRALYSRIEKNDCRLR